MTKPWIVTDADGQVLHGTPVKYHGSIKAEHWATWIVTAIADDGRYTLTDRDYPQSVLKQVRRTSITPTGDPALPMCACGHPVPWTLRGEDDVCAVCGWQCHNHIPSDVTSARMSRTPTKQEERNRESRRP